MTIDEILKLGAMGYTKEDIEAMNSGQAEPEPAQTEPEPEPAKEPEQAKDPEPQKEPDMMAFIVSEFEKMRKDIQQMNITKSNLPQDTGKTAEQVLAELIAPPQKGGKNK